MEEKESTHSESLGNSESGSPPAPFEDVLTAATAAVSTTTGNVGSRGDFPEKKKRGRPRKYDADGNLRLTASAGSPTGGFSLSPCGFSSSKRARGRPSSGNWKLLASFGEVFANTAGGDFTPHVVTVNTGEDVAEKILCFSEKGLRGICVMSANGAVSNVTLRQSGSSGGTLTYEGRFEILSLTGSYIVSETGGARSRTGGLSVSLAGPDGRVIGGGLAGLLTAASPIQIVVGSFMPNAYKLHKKKQIREQAMILLSPRLETNNGSMTTPSPLRKPMNGSGGDDDSIERQNLNFSNQNATWNGGAETTNSQIQRPSPDINVSISCGE